MNALIWKRLKEIRCKWINSILFIILPPTYLITLYFMNIKIANIIAFGSLLITLFGTIIHFSVEDLISSESLLSTSLHIKKIWATNLLFVVFTGYVYSTIIVFLESYYLHNIGMSIDININIVIQYVVNLLIALSFIGCSTCHYADYSFSKQLLASVFAVINIITPIIFILFGNSILISKFSIIISLILSIVLFLTSYIIISNANKESLIINIQKLVTTYNNNNIDE